MNPNLHNVADLERIDALADDLATATRLIAELEAEVERLKTDLIWWALHASSVHRCDHNIEGGRRESGDQGPGSVPGRPGRPAAANPAARKERLSRHDSAATAMLAILATPEQWAEFQRVARGVNPSGDTLGRKERDEG